MGTVLFRKLKSTGWSFDHSPPSSVEVKERVELYLLIAFRDFMNCYKVNFTILLNARLGYKDFQTAVCISYFPYFFSRISTKISTGIL